MTVSEQRIPLSVIGEALRPLILTDSLIPHCIGQTQHWYVPGSSTLTYLTVPNGFDTRNITYEAELLAVVAATFIATHRQKIYIHEDFNYLFIHGRFANFMHSQYFLERLFQIQIKMIFGNIDYSFRLGYRDYDHNGATVFHPSPEFIAAYQDLYDVVSLTTYPKFSQPLARRVYRAIAREDILFDTVYSAEQLCHILRLYTGKQTDAGYTMYPLSMHQIRQRLYRIQHELIESRLISGIKSVNTGRMTTLRFLRGTRVPLRWP